MHARIKHAERDSSRQNKEREWLRSILRQSLINQSSWEEMPGIFAIFSQAFNPCPQRHSIIILTDICDSITSSLLNRRTILGTGSLRYSTKPCSVKGSPVWTLPILSH